MTQVKIWINKKKVISGQYIDLVLTENKPQVKIIDKSQYYYTLLMVDPDAPSHENPIYKYYLHWLVINTNMEIVKYMKPQPPIHSGIHRYVFMLFRQEYYIEPTIIFKSRKNFDLTSFVKKYRLHLINSIFYRSFKNNP